MNGRAHMTYKGHGVQQYAVEIVDKRTGEVFSRGEGKFTKGGTVNNIDRELGRTQRCIDINYSARIVKR